MDSVYNRRPQSTQANQEEVTSQIADIIQKVETSTEKMVSDPEKADIEAGSEGVTDWQGSKMLMATSGTEGDVGGSGCKKAAEVVFSFPNTIPNML